MTYTIEFSRAFDWKHFRKLPRDMLLRLREAIDQKLTLHPETFGKPMRYSRKGTRSLRVGEYRILFEIKLSTVIILAIDHRSRIY